MRLVSVAALLSVALLATHPARAETTKQATPWYEVGGQITAIDQTLFAFPSPYQGANSLRNPAGLPFGVENSLSHTYTLYLGIRPLPGLDLYLDPEMARGTGISGASGVAGYVNGDVIRNPSLSQDPYLARAFARYVYGLGGETSEVPPGENQIGGPLPTSRVQVTVGKLGSNDLFDQNAYASSTRTEFANWALINNTAYDYAADTRGYSIGAAVEWVHPAWTLRAGTFQMPSEANGPGLDPDLAHAHGDQVELELHPVVLPDRHGVVRLLGYLNHARMGTYAPAIAAPPPGQVPDITQTRQVGALKYGLGLNLEQPLADDGDTGLFMRLGWDDGQTESFAFTEADQAFSLGSQVSGTHWGRKDDRWGLAIAVNGLSPQHAGYLAAGGLGFLLGDGRLTYGPETIIESYYAWSLTKAWTASLDYQWVANPGYNQDRGPASVLGLRLHAEL